MLVDYLEKIFAERCRKNPQYSLRSFARALGIDSSTLSAILRRKRPLTAKSAKKLIERLPELSPMEAQSLLMSVVAPTGPREITYNELELQKAEMVSSWEHFAILAFLETATRRRDVRSIANRLKIPTGVVLEALHRMERIGMIGYTKAGWIIKSKNFTTPRNVSSNARREVLRQLILKSIDSLDRDPVDKRDITGVTIAVNSKRLAEAIPMIKEFRRNLSEFLEAGERDQVYRLNIQLFPLTSEENP